MSFPYAKCKAVLLEGILGSLAAHRGAIEAMQTGWYHPACGLDLDLFPWEPTSCNLSLQSSFDERREFHDPLSWKLGYFASSNAESGTFFAPAVELIGNLYSSTEDSDEAREIAHMIFLAGADALLHARVAESLRSMGVFAPTISDKFPEHTHTCFRYTVFDSDGSFRANYCEIVLANRMAVRMLSNQAKGASS